MDYVVKTCIYQPSNGELKDFDCAKSLNKIGFECKVISGNYENLIEYMALNKVDMLIADTTGADKETFEINFQLIKNSFCKQIVAVVENEENKFQNVKEHITISDKCFEEKLRIILFRLKAEIISKPCNNIGMVKAKAIEFLIKFNFVTSQTGFNFFVDAIAQEYFKYPFVIPMMKIYANIAKKYNKTVASVEKSMRDTLNAVIKHTYKLPQTEEYYLHHAFFGVEANNFRVICSIVNLLLREEGFYKDIVVYKQ